MFKISLSVGRKAKLHLAAIYLLLKQQLNAYDSQMMYETNKLIK